MASKRVVGGAVAAATEYVKQGIHQCRRAFQRHSSAGCCGSLRWPHVRILLRADSDFARDELMAWCEANGVDFVFGLQQNERLVDEIKFELHRAGEPPSRHDASGSSSIEHAAPGAASAGSSAYAAAASAPA
jgi:hypothetical protein